MGSSAQCEHVAGLSRGRPRNVPNSDCLLSASRRLAPSPRRWRVLLSVFVLVVHLHALVACRLLLALAFPLAFPLATWLTLGRLRFCPDVIILLVVLFVRILSLSISVLLLLGRLPADAPPALVLSVLKRRFANRLKFAEIVACCPVFLACGALMVPSAINIEAVSVHARLAIGGIARDAAGYNLRSRMSAPTEGLRMRVLASMHIVHSMISLSYVERRYGCNSRIVRVDKEYRPLLEGRAYGQEVRVDWEDAHETHLLLTSQPLATKLLSVASA